MSDDNTVLRIREDALDWVEVDSEVVVLDSQQDKYLGTNRSGALLWQELARGATRDELVQVLADTFDITAEVAARDTDTFLSALREQGLLVEG